MTARINRFGNYQNTTIQTGNAITKDETLTKLEELKTAFEDGEISYTMLYNRFKSLNVTLRRVTGGCSFTYNGKTYTFKPKTTNNQNTKYSSTTLKNVYRFSDETINKYFKKSGEDYVLNTLVAKSIMEVAEATAQEYRKKQIVANFLNDKNRTSDSSSALYNTSDGKTINSYNYQDYMDEISKTVSGDEKSIKDQVVNKAVADYTQGNLVYYVFRGILLAIGVQPTKTTPQQMCFTYDNKSYKLYCPYSAAKSSTDDITTELYSADILQKTGASQELIDKYFLASTTIDGEAKDYTLRTGATYAAFLADVKASTKSTYTFDELKNTYKFSDEIINKYFKNEKDTSYAKPNSSNSTNTDVYVLNTETGCKTIEDVEKVAVQEYQTKQVLINFLNDKNKKTDSTTEMKKTSDNKELTVENYKNYVDGINSAFGDDEEAVKQKALEKFIKDFTQGNIAFTDITVIANAIGIGDRKIGFIGNSLELGCEFEYNGKSYKIYSEALALTSGTDNLTITTYAADDLTKTGATQAQIDKYFYNVASVDGKNTSYALKNSQKYEDFLAEVKKSQAKNGTFEGKNADGKWTETTYVDGVVTKVVTHAYSYKSSTIVSETEYYENGQVKNEKKYTGYDDKLKSESEYYDNGQVKNEKKYAYGGVLESEAEYDKNGKMLSKTELDTNWRNSDGKMITVYNDDGSSVKTVYDKSGKQILEVQTTANGTGRYFSVEIADDGTKTMTEYNSEDAARDGGTHNRTGIERYDAQGRLIYRSKYRSTYAYTDTKYIYNADGSRREVSYSSHGDNTKGDITSDKTYDKDGRLIKTASYETYDSKQQDIPSKEVTYSYDADGAVQSTTTVEYKVIHKSGKGYYQEKKSETVTDKNGKLISEIKYDVEVDAEKSIYGDIKTAVDGDKTTESVYVSNNLTKETITDRTNNTQTTTIYKNGKKSSAITKDLSGNKLSEIVYDSNGKMQYEVKYTRNGNDTEEITTFADGRVATRKNGATSAELKDKDGNVVGTLVRNTTKVVTGTTIDEVITGKNYDCMDIKDKNGNIISRIIYNSDGTVNYTQTYTYEYTDSKNYKVIIKDPNGDKHTEIYENGKKTKTYHWFQATRSTIVQEEGKGSARDRLTGSVKMSGQTMSAQTLYGVITNPSARTGFLYTGYGLIDQITGVSNSISKQLLQMAQTNYNGTPSGCSKKMIGCNDVSAEYRDTLKNIINKKVNEYGITADEIQGYNFPSTSTIAKTMASDGDMKNFVKSNIKDLINGTNMPKTMAFNNNKDLSYAFHGVDVLASKLSGTTLTLTIMDVYDFDGSKTGNSNSDIFNRAGNAAMKDGKLKPYYTLTEVKIDLTSLGYTAAQIQAMKA